jgi:hypothetical protein
VLGAKRLKHKLGGLETGRDLEVGWNELGHAIDPRSSAQAEPEKRTTGAVRGPRETRSGSEERFASRWVDVMLVARDGVEEVRHTTTIYASQPTPAATTDGR